MIPAQLAGFLESGVSVLVATRDARLSPDALRAMGVRVERGGAELTVFLPAATSREALANLRDNGRIAVCFSRAADHRSVQVKGRAVEVGEAGADERERVERYLDALADAWGVIGIPARATLRLAHWPCHAVRVRVEGVFVQTPGPDAGAPLVDVAGRAP
ncbi:MULTISPECIES: pyridoxamine 5'-phosphate oxidase family protein [Anaeromyxobacter]|uniref:pyridoxamine 5'-phosphate oxidase family protein n=1 Tax=Anaeromyxobacter TaxID=161492 RepID=UPI001F597908|nr:MULTISPECIES: pyridoxamine 5'-phosphate oxidase family protein [unclassified Anaeromyxobacter]